MNASSKNPGIAILLSFFFAGLGQLYNEQILKGLLIALVYLLLWIIAIGRFLFGDLMFRPEGMSEGIEYGLIAFFCIPAVLIGSMIDAKRTAQKINDQAN